MLMESSRVPPSACALDYRHGTSASVLAPHTTGRVKATPEEARASILSWLQTTEDAAAPRGPPQSKRVFPSPTVPSVAVVPQESSPGVVPEGAAEEALPPLPEPSDEEDMDISSSRKHPRPEDSSDDEADAPRKLIPADPSAQDDSSNDSSGFLLSSESDTSKDSTATTDTSSTSTTTADASDSPHPNDLASSSRPPAVPTLAPAAPTPPVSQPVDREGFQPVLTKPARRRARDLAGATLPVDPAVVQPTDNRVAAGSP
ncbi:hypothetical protein MTO96_005838 [Rhipicephalus appendiculatus]